MLKLLPLLLLFAAPAASARDARGLAQALVELRQTTEGLNDQVEEARRAGIEQRRALATQQTELDAERTRASLRVAQLKETLERRKAAMEGWQSTKTKYRWLNILGIPFAFVLFGVIRWRMRQEKRASIKL